MNRSRTLVMTLLASALTGCAPDLVTGPVNEPEPRAEPSVGAECTLEFSGYRWCVRQTRLGGPGPNAWDARNAWVDSAGLHLRLSSDAAAWSAAEVYSALAFGYGTYEFELASEVRALDRNVVLGLFSYADGAADSTQEIDIELARWGRQAAPNLNYTVWPASAGERASSNASSWQQAGPSLHRYTWRRTSVWFQSYAGPVSTAAALLREWRYAPRRAAASIPQRAMPVHLNLWLYQGTPPSDGREVEVVIRSFRYIAERAP